MKFSKEFKVGLFAIISIAIFYWGFNYLKGIEFLSPIKRYYVVYDDIVGLQRSNPVVINGFSVGRVSDIKLLQQKGNKVLVELEIDEEIVLGDSTVAFLDVDLLGSVSIVLEIGESSTFIQDGDTLEARLDKALEDLIKESTLPVADNLQITIRRINTILDGLSGNTEKISNTLGNLEDVTHNIKSLTSSDTKQKINDLLENLNAVANELKTTVRKVDPMVQKYGALADSLKSVDIQTTLNNANKMLTSLDSLLVNINEGDGTLTKLVHNDSLYNNLNKALEDLDKLLIHMNENPKHFFAPLGKSSKKIQKDLRKKENDN